MEGAIGANSVIITKATVAPTANISSKADKTRQINQKLNPAASVFIVGVFTNTKLNPAAKDFSIKSTIFYEEAVTTIGTPETPMNVVAHYKALEAAPYESMENPRESLVCCGYIPSVHAEYHCSDEDRIDEETLNKIRRLDDNGVENIPLFTGSTPANMTTSNMPISSLSVDELFSEVSATGVAKIYVAELSNKFMLHSTGPSVCLKAFSQLSPFLEVFQSSIHSKGNGSRDSIEEEMRSRSFPLTTNTA